MIDPRRARLIEDLIAHLESMDADDLKSQMKPVEASIEVAEIDPDKAKDFRDGFNGKKKLAMVDGEKGPMEQLVAQKDGEACEHAEPDGDELSEEDFEDLVKNAH